MRLSYSLRFHNHKQHLIDVCLCIHSSVQAGLTLTMPAWIPGSYMIRDYARHIVSIRAEAQGRSVTLKKLDKQSWQLQSVSRDLSVHYQVYAYDLSVRGAHVDDEHIYFNGAAVFLQVQEMEHQPCSIILDKQSIPDDWQITSSFQQQATGKPEQILFQADHYDDLIDHPVEIGTQETHAFKVLDVPHSISFTGYHQADTGRIMQDLERICRQQSRHFSDDLPVDRYCFLTMLTGDGYGGLEHRYSSSLMCARQDLIAKHQTTVDKGYIKFLGLCSHEYFHLWNVRRIRPQVFVNGNLNHEVHTELLWWFEGVTSYYDDLALVRSGVISEADYLNLLAHNMSRLQRVPGRCRQTLAESSFDAWTRFYKQDENAANAIVSYYLKGALVALALDLTIRNKTSSRQSLDDLLQAVWQRFGKTQTGVPERGIEQLAAEVIDADLQDFFAKALYSTEEIHFESLLEPLGLLLQYRQARDDEDLGGFLEQVPVESSPRLYTGIQFSSNACGMLCRSIINDSPAERAGVAPGDRLLAVNSIEASSGVMQFMLKNASSGDEMILHLFRADVLLQRSLILKPAPEDCADLTLHPSARSAQVQARKAWLSGY
ncbi:MAG: peptidase M61 [gamma proteobacterium symbiont of Bathyaustriella thionipta]|nr:peptidase M61 [gamma proteobacterium symbiont of Bathyaustriella thionipta]